jgi:hypothetical protein
MSFAALARPVLKLRRGIWISPPGPIAEGLRVGLLGGSFNPAHRGHLHVSEAALKALQLDYVWWLVAPQNPLKSDQRMAGLAERVAGAGAIADHPKIRVSATISYRFRIGGIGEGSSRQFRSRS